MSRPDNLLVGEHFNSPVGKRGKEDCTVNCERGQPPVNCVDVRLFLTGGGRDIDMFTLKLYRNPRGDRGQQGRSFLAAGNQTQRTHRSGLLALSCVERAPRSEKENMKREA